MITSDLAFSGKVDFTVLWVFHKIRNREVLHNSRSHLGQTQLYTVFAVFSSTSVQRWYAIVMYKPAKTDVNAITSTSRRFVFATKTMTRLVIALAWRVLTFDKRLIDVCCPWIGSAIWKLISCLCGGEQLPGQAGDCAPCAASRDRLMT